jgi:internalin A
MSKSRHWMFVAIWATVLVLATALLWDRLFPGQRLRPAGAAAVGQGPAQSPPSALAAIPLEPTDPAAVRLNQAVRARNRDYSGQGRFAHRGGQVVVADLSRTGVSDLSPLVGLPLEALDISGNPVSDLRPLKGMGLRKLGLEGTGVADLSPLAGMHLEELYANGAPVRDLTPLAGMPLRMLNLYGTGVSDLAPLAGAPLKSLWLNGTGVRDVSPLARCPLVSLTLERTPVADLSPLAVCKLERLHVGMSAVTDLTPLAAMPLQRLIFTPQKISRGLDAVRNMASIRELGTTLEGRMPPEAFWPLYDQGRFGPPK